MIDLNRRHLMAGLGATMGATCMTSLTRGAFATPTKAEFEQRLAAAEQSGKVNGLHALLVAKGDKILFEHYGVGVDERWGTPLGTVTFGPEVMHDLRSVSKSVVGLLYGIALSQGKVPAPEAKLYAQFPQYADLAQQPGRDKLTMAHVLSMTLGFEWDELTVPYGRDPRNSEIAMILAPDRFRYILSLPIVTEPGTKWIYCGGATAILGYLISKGTGMKLLDYARSVLFEPMGFGATDWVLGDDGVPQTASGLRLLPRDLLKIGQLALAGGSWNGKQLVPAEWMKKVTTPSVVIEGPRSYGWQWYIYDTMINGQKQHWVGGIGWGGQRLYVFPDLDLVVAMNCGNYSKPGAEQSRVNTTVVNEVVFPSLS
jgi:CubicO group peptidase (beta-lactamase class C family)